MDPNNNSNDGHNLPPSSSNEVSTDTVNAEKLLVQELNGLSIKEREKVYEDIHGVASKIEETPEFVAQRLNELQIELQKNHPRKAYELAMEQSSIYVQSLYVQFLRSANFDPQSAASKLVQFFENKLDLFGIELLAKHIGYDDLNNLDQQSIQSGWIQMLPYRDRSGRAVMWANHSERRKNIPAENHARAFFYITTSISDDEETQKQGIVGVIFGMDKLEISQAATRNTMKKISKLSGSLPLKIVGHHICLESKRLSQFIYLILMAASKDARLRTRVHQGTFTEISYALMTFGIPVSFAPISSGGTMKVKYLRQWLARRSQLDALRKRQNPIQPGIYFNISNKDREIELPHYSDILLGCGVGAQSYSGNVQFRILMDKYRDQYNQCTKKGSKKLFLEKLYDLLHSSEYNARFLERSSPDDWWRIVPKDVVLKKIAHRLRSKKLPNSVPLPDPITILISDDDATDHNDKSAKNDGNDVVILNTMFLNQSGKSFHFNCCWNEVNATGPSKRMRYS